MLESVVSLDEMFLNASVGAVQAPMAVNCAYYLAIAPYPLQVTSGWFSFYGTVTGTKDDYHRISLCRRRGSEFVRIAVGYTKPSGQSNWGGKLSYGTSYSWNAFPFNENNSLLLPGDQLAAEITAYGSPAAPKGPMVVTVGFQPS